MVDHTEVDGNVSGMQNDALHLNSDTLIAVNNARPSDTGNITGTRAGGSETGEGDHDYDFLGGLSDNDADNSQYESEDGMYC